ncbi:hypothetical protein CapIbe_014168 [Capra ibex]
MNCKDMRTQEEGTKMFGSVGHQVIVNPGTSIVTGPSDSSKQLHRPLGQRPAWRSECPPAAGRGWQSASQNGDASEQVLGAVLTYTVEYVNILTFTIPGVPYTLLHPAVFLLKDDCHVGSYAGAAAWYLWFQEPAWRS